MTRRKFSSKFKIEAIRLVTTCRLFSPSSGSNKTHLAVQDLPDPQLVERP